MDISRIGRYNPLATTAINFDQSADKQKRGTKPENVAISREPINDFFIEPAKTIASGTVLSYSEARVASRKAAVDNAVGAEKAKMEMRMYAGEYCDIFSGGSITGWRNTDMDTMYSQATEIYKQIEDSSDSEETKALKRQGLENALKTGTGFYKMRMVGEKMRNDALKAEAQGKPIDRTYRSKAKFDKLCSLSNALDNITSTFFNNLKNGRGEGFDYSKMISDATNKIMCYK